MSSPRILVLINPRLARRVGSLEALLQNTLGADCAVETVEGTQALARRAQLARDQGFSRLAVAGGDGTVGLAIRALRDNPLPLAIIPVGTFNNFATSLGIPTALEEACRVAVNGRSRGVDLGQVTSKRPPATFVFKEMVGVGVDATAFCTSVDVAGPAKIPVGALATLSAILSFRPHPVRFRAVGQKKWARSTQLVIANTPRYGAAFPVVPEAVPDDGQLDLVARTWRGRLDLLRDLPHMLRGRHSDLEHDVYRRATEVELKGHSQIILHADGEFFARLPARVQVLPRAIDIIVP